MITCNHHNERSADSADVALLMNERAFVAELDQGCPVVVVLPGAGCSHGGR
jgi:hypothetical protein